MMHTAPYDKAKEKKDGPRHVDDVFWAKCKFFIYFSTLIWYTNWFFYTWIKGDGTYGAVWQGENKKTTQDTLTCLGPYVSFFFYL